MDTLYLLEFCRIYWIRFVTLRFFTVWGDGQRRDLALARFIACLLNGEPVQVNGDGTRRRDLTRVALAVHWPAPDSGAGLIAGQFCREAHSHCSPQ